jgi:hypothetical protein
MNTSLEGGNYFMNLYYGFRVANNNRVGMGRLQLSNVNGAAQFIHTASNQLATNGDNWNTDIIPLTLPTGANQFIFQYAVNTVNGGTTLTVTRVQMTLYRVNAFTQL